MSSDGSSIGLLLALSSSSIVWARSRSLRIREPKLFVKPAISQIVIRLPGQELRKPLDWRATGKNYREKARVWRDREEA